MFPLRDDNPTLGTSWVTFLIIGSTPWRGSSSTRIVVPAFLMLGYWFIIQLLGGIPALAGATGGIAFGAHVGGFLAGVILCKVLCNPQRAAVCQGRKGRTDRMLQRVRTP